MAVSMAVTMSISGYQKSRHTRQSQCPYDDGNDNTLRHKTHRMMARKRISTQDPTRSTLNVPMRACTMIDPPHGPVAHATFPVSRRDARQRGRRCPSVRIPMTSSSWPRARVRH